MKPLHGTLTGILGVALLLTIGCGGNDANAGRNADIARKLEKIAAESPTRSSLSALQMSALDARKNRDKAFWRQYLDEAFVSFRNGVRRDRLSELAEIDEDKCEYESHRLSGETLVPIGNDAVMLTAKADIQGVCGGDPAASPVTIATLYVRSGDKWRAAYHAQAAAFSVPATAKPRDGKRPEPPPTVSSPAPLEAALAELERRVRNAVKTRSASDLQTAFTEDVTRVDRSGAVTIGKSAVVDGLTSAGCKVARSEISGVQASPISSAVAILTYKANIEGTCDGKPLGPVWGTSVMQKVAGEWRIAYIFETQA